MIALLRKPAWWGTPEQRRRAELNGPIAHPAWEYYTVADFPGPAGTILPKEIQFVAWVSQ